MLWIRKIVQSFIEIPGLFITLIILLNFKIKKQNISRRMIIFTSVIIYLLSIQITSRILVFPLEDSFNTIDYNKIDYTIPSLIVVLGGGVIPKTPNSPLIGELSDQTFKRLFVGYELHKKTNFPIVISGGKPPNTDYIPEAFVMRDYLVRLGVSPSNIIIEQEAQTTEENAKYIKNLLDSIKINRIFLVTSAIHMPRSYKIFSNYLYNIEIVPIPSNYLITREKITWIDFKPDISALEANAMALHEYIGLIFYLIFK
ncbi:YdcF family protein [Marinitoga sp. 38H-ov]|uniref:YdcF family protein n=1 Tax=Marinitoga sp. 38H-ov TaxID=1755814 RepID=UPI0013EB0EAC|nr:YdcF family protein [Marinitoga sp. 38H-ov]KAF2955374.1 hypothetical protein AS160_10575 [Marinitoga sp. 38H-ov]